MTDEPKHPSTPEHLQPTLDPPAQPPHGNDAAGNANERTTSPALSNEPVRDELPERIGRYQVRRRLGSGGFGWVYLGHDEQMNRAVAIKVPRAELLATERAREEFLREARSVANLHHDHIVPVYDFGDNGPAGACYLVYRFIEGMDLAARIKLGPLPPAEAAMLIAQVAEALDYAHSKGVIHRDLKPPNILLARSDRIHAVDAARKGSDESEHYEPFVADFGLAVRADELARQRGRLAGTREYMAPEQVRREGHRLDNRTDIFSLGVVLYELLAGQRPFVADSYAELFDQIEHHDPRPPRLLVPTVPKELERICLKAMSKRKPDRYQTAGDMAEELRSAVAALTGAKPGSAAATAIVVQVQMPAALTPAGTPTAPVVTAGSPPGAAPVTPGVSAPMSPGAAMTALTPPDSGDLAVRIRPKGLRSFDADDKEFFLELLPGPRDRDGLPDSIRFWKTRIENRGRDKPFAIGLIYGPSGCGKSSLMKAGLLPRLAESVTAVYIESTRDDTESRLLRALKKACPELATTMGSGVRISVLPEEIAGLGQGALPGKTEIRTPDPLVSTHGLTDLIAALRRREPVAAGQPALPPRTLIVLDQFEQWLHTHGTDMERTELVDALRQADGEHVQFVLMVRDDFWLAVSRLADVLELHFVPGENQRLVDLFDLRHARRVLQLFGQAYGCLPDRSTQFTPDQNAFLDQVVERLSEDGKVISVRVSLFADMMKGRAWTPESLRAVGGTEGVGVIFLEETFSARTAAPEHRSFEKPARAVLAALLPEAGSDIKGRMRSHAELLELSSLAAEPRRFDRLLEILDRELRIITPTEEGSGFGVQGSEIRGQDSTPSALNPEPRTLTPLFYQLTHDYLVPPLREWLTRKERETWRGRARLRLEERAAQWTRSRDSRFLPKPLEYLSIVAGVSRKKRTPPQRAVMRAAHRWYGAAATLVALAMTLFGWGAWQTNGDVQGRRLTQAIYAAKPGELRKLIDESLPAYRRWADPVLQRVANAADAEPEQRLKASLALVPVDETQVGYLSARLLDCSVDEFPVVRDYLKPHQVTLEAQLWETLRDTGQPERRRFHAGMALAAFAPQANDWTEMDADFLAGQLLGSNPDYQRDLRSYLKEIAPRLGGPLQVRFRDAAARDAVREAAASALAEFDADDPDLLARLSSEATPEQHRILWPRLSADSTRRDQAVKTLLAITQEQPAKDASESDRVQLGRRRAGAAINLVRMGQRESSFDVFRVQQDPESLTQFVHRAKDRGVTAAELLDCLDRATEERVRFALLLALGEFAIADVPEARRQPLTEKLLDWYRTDPSSAIHGACGWLLRKPDWELKDQIRDVDQTPLPYDPTDQREWFVEKIGDDAMTFVVFPPGEFQMGSPDATSPAEEEGRNPDETSHIVRLTRSFAVLDREVTRGQFERFLEATKNKFVNIDQWSPSGEHPVVGEMWYEAVLFCRWLTQEAGLTEDDQCYEDPETLPKDPDGFPENWPFHPERRGFRLPTEAEWEYACRGGTQTAFGFGSDRAILARYGWFLDNEGKKTHIGGELRPNLRGLFDLHGNAFEWCHDWYGGYDTADDVDPSGPKQKAQSRLLRGGGWNGNARSCRSAYRDFQPASRLTSNGFRVVVSCGVGGQDSKRKP